MRNPQKVYLLVAVGHWQVKRAHKRTGKQSSQREAFVSQSHSELNTCWALDSPETAVNRAAAGADGDRHGHETIKKSSCSHPKPLGKSITTNPGLEQSQTNDSYQKRNSRKKTPENWRAAPRRCSLVQPVSRPDSCSPGVVQAGWGWGPVHWYQIVFAHQVPLGKTGDKDNCVEEGLVQGRCSVRQLSDSEFS